MRFRGDRADKSQNIRSWDMGFIRALGAGVVVCGIAAAAPAQQAVAPCERVAPCVAAVALADQAKSDDGDDWAALHALTVAQSSQGGDAVTFVGGAVPFGEMRYATLFAGPRFGDAARLDAPALDPWSLAAGMRGLTGSPFTGSRGEDLAAWASAKVGESSRSQIYALMLAAVIGVLSLSRRRELS
jgi:hypothetical protein